MYFTDCKVINQNEEVDVQKFAKYKAVGFISLTSSEWRTSSGANRLQFLEQYLVMKDECFFYISTDLGIRERFITNLQLCNKDFKITEGQDFIAYYKTVDIKYKATEIFLEKLPVSIDETLEKIEGVIDELKLGIVVGKVQEELLKKTGLFIFEILKKLVMA
jgi:hypothetical protein